MFVVSEDGEDVINLARFDFIRFGGNDKMWWVEAVRLASTADGKDVEQESPYLICSEDFERVSGYHAQLVKAMKAHVINCDGN